MEDIFVKKCVTIREDQEIFIKDEKKNGKRFNMSRFLQFKLDEYIKSRKEYYKFMEEVK